MDERFMRELLEREVLGRHEREVVLSCEVRKLRSSLRKTIIQYVVHLKNRSTRTYIGVHRESDSRLAKTFSILKPPRSNGFVMVSGLMVPRPITYVPSLSLLLTEQAEGRLMRELFEERGDKLRFQIDRDCS